MADDVITLSKTAVENKSIHVSMFYTGHGNSPDEKGQNGGGWVLFKYDKKGNQRGSKIFHLIQMFEAIKEGGYKGNLSLICNACFSGGWANHAFALWN